MNLIVKFQQRRADDDVQCLSKVRRGDRSAMLALYRQHEPEVVHFIGMLTGCEQRTAELVTDTFLAAWQQAPASSHVTCVRTWILAIACGVALRSLEGEGTFAATRIVPARGGEKGEVSPRFVRDIAWLPLAPRAALVLAYGLGCSANEIAAIMTCPVDEVDDRIASARSVLHALRDAQ